MSNLSLSPRAFVAFVAVMVATSLACASRRPIDTEAASSQSPPDTTKALNTDGKSIEDLFAGRFPGVSVARTGDGGLQIRIRGGSNTFYGSDEPLYVVDDTPLPTGSRGIVFLNPHDIQKIEVLKNPADIAIYGIRGGNGVIKITTKRPGSTSS
ncbi:MAG: TonB-dependent receptor plug domain-containing protein [Gemmatimonadaceae bacterium]